MVEINSDTDVRCNLVLVLGILPGIGQEEATGLSLLNLLRRR
jgi:hypothetical protein